MKDLTGKIAVSRTRTLDTLVDGWGASELTGMEELFRFVVRYEYLFWDMALKGSEWPV